MYHRERMVNLKLPAYVGAKLAVLGGLCLIQCAVLLGIVHWGAGLRGPWPAMFLLLVLSSFVGLAIGLTVSAVAPTSEVAVALLPLILIPMVILAGALQPLHKMNAVGGTLAQAIPSRWAFEGLLLLETAHRPRGTPPALPPVVRPAEGETLAAAQPREQDLSESFFPVDEHRLSVRAGVLALGVMLFLLVAASHAILRARDVH